MDHQVSARQRRNPPTGRPTPREIKALKAVQDGSPLSVAAARVGMSTTSLGSLLSVVYRRLGIRRSAVHRLSKDRRRMAVNICKREGWWPDHG
jgi:hypothetical protein